MSGTGIAVGIIVGWIACELMRIRDQRTAHDGGTTARNLHALWESERELRGQVKQLSNAVREAHRWGWQSAEEYLVGTTNDDAEAGHWLQNKIHLGCAVRPQKDTPRE